MRAIQTIIAGTSYIRGGGAPDINYPVPGSGPYRTAATALSGISYADIGVPAAATGGVNDVADGVNGLWRRKYDGNFCVDAQDTVGAYDLNWFAGKTPLNSEYDGYLSWGAQDDGPGVGQHNFSIEWLGYIQLSTQKWNFYVESDDTCAVWIGADAVSGFSAVNCLVSSSNKTLPGSATDSRSSNSLSFDGTKYYPIRIWFSEFTGGCKFQLYALGEDGTKLAGNGMGRFVNNTTKGFNP